TQGAALSERPDPGSYPGRAGLAAQARPLPNARCPTARGRAFTLRGRASDVPPSCPASPGGRRVPLTTPRGTARKGSRTTLAPHLGSPRPDGVAGVFCVLYPSGTRPGTPIAGPPSGVGSRMACTCVVGLQWGDEAKGKIVDLLTDRHDLVV